MAAAAPVSAEYPDTPYSARSSTPLTPTPQSVGSRGSRAASNAADLAAGFRAPSSATDLRQSPLAARKLPVGDPGLASPRRLSPADITNPLTQESNDIGSLKARDSTPPPAADAGGARSSLIASAIFERITSRLYVSGSI